MKNLFKWLAGTILISIIMITSSQAVSLNVRVSSGNDDAEQRISNGNMDRNNDGLDIVYDGNNKQAVGLRFTNITIPKGSVINSATIYFKSRSDKSNSASFVISGQSADNPGNFSSTNYDITNRSKTTATVGWNNVATWSNNDQNANTTTPELKTILQEIVNRSGWASGNAMVFILEGSGTRTADSYDGSSNSAPYLQINYTSPPVGTCNGDQNGLIGNYYNNATFISPIIMSRVDSTINFDWGNSNPGGGVNNDNFSTEWTGNIYFPEDAYYTFSLAHDDAITLIINGVTLYNNETWTGGASSFRDTTAIHYAAGTYPITIRFIEWGGGAYSKLAWRNNASISSRTIIPTLNLCTSALSNNIPPVANAGADQTITVGNSVTLDGSGSSDSDGSIASYSWNVNGTIHIGVSPTISGLAEGTHNITLTLTDNDGATNDDTVLITVNAAPVNNAPVITSNGGGATASISIASGTTTVTTVQATDSDSDTLTYSISGTDSASFTINTSTGVLTLKPSANAQTSYAITVKVSDGKGGEDSQNLTVTITTNAVNFTCANPRTYSQVYSANLPGQIDIIGNSVVCQKNNNNGECSNPGNARNNDINMIHINIDSDNTTFNHSSAELNIPADSQIKWAGLYWQGIFAGPTSDQQNNSKTIKLKVPGGSYVDITSDNNKYNWVYLDETKDRWMYQGVADITNKININNPNGYYSIANLQTAEGQPSGGSFGAWSIVIVYYNKSMPIRNLTVYDGYQGVMPGGNGIGCNDRSGDPRAACLYAQNHNCPTDLASTGVANPINVPLTGFLTPKAGAVESTFALFSGEGDRGLTGDQMSITNKSGIAAYISDTQNPVNDVQNATISRKGVQVTTLEPQATLAGGTPWPNTLGADIDLFDISGKLDNDQSSTLLKLNTSGDGYFPGVFAFSTELYQPKLCYDYAYKQHEQYFTEDNNGSYLPQIVGTGLSTSEPITVELFIQNTEISDIMLSNVTLDIFDINTTQATYISPSTSLILPDQVLPTLYTDTNYGISYNNDIAIGDVDTQDFFYVDYKLSPIMSNIDMPLNIRLNYDVNFPVGTGDPINLHYETYLNTEIPLCSALNFLYSPVYGTFNVEDGTLAGIESDTVGKLYNLPTQTANRPGSFKVAAYDLVNTNTRKNVSTVVAIELIDAGKYHGIDASCSEPDSALTPRIWVTFDNNVSLTDFNADTIQTAIDNGLLSTDILGGTSITSAGEYYKNVRENTAFRISYNTPGGDGDLISLAPNSCKGNQVPPCYTVNNFPDFSKIDIGAGAGNCGQNVDGNPNSTDKIPQYCGNAGNAGLDSVQLANCMECIYGYNIKFLCSRDNFAIRPESFRIALKDQNQNDATQQSSIALNNNVSVTHDNSNVNNTGYQIAAGYQYALEINATNHENETPTPGYYVSFLFDGENDTRTFKLKWHDILNNAYCNVTEDQNKTLTFFNGQVDLNISSDQVGKYNLNLFDKLWTKVDWDPAVMLHHVGQHFLTGLDCVPNTSDIPLLGATTTTSGINLTNVSGCDINSSSHINSDTGAKYTDVPLRVHPYKFDQSAVMPAIGPYTRTNGQTFVYIDTPPTMDANDTEMSYNMNGTFAAVGYDNGRLSNFVKECYGDDVKMDLNFTYNIPEPLITPYLSYSLKDHNTSDNTVVYRPDSGTDDFEVAQHNSISTPFSIVQGKEFFATDMNGSITMDLGYNFIRTYNQALNPRDIEFHDFNITYVVNPTGIKADLADNFKIFGDRTLDHNVTFVYGRAKSSQYLYDDVTQNSINTPISIVVYCDQDPIACSAVYNIDTVLGKTDEYQWYLSRGHIIDDNDGNITLISSAGGTVSSTDPTTVDINNSGGIDPNIIVTATATTRPLDVNIDFGSNTNRWLIYNQDIDAIPSPFYKVRFIGESGWAGHGDTGHVVDSNVSTKKNRRLGW